MSDLNLPEILKNHQLWLNDEGGKRAYLSGANLSWANLSGANLSGAVGNMGEIKSLFLDHWPVTYTATVMQIGCQRHSIEEWFGFSDERISSMDRNALVWWKRHKALIEQAVALCPATPTGPQNKEQAA